MSFVVFSKLLSLLITVVLGWVAGRMRWLGDERRGADPARTLSGAAFYIFIPALLFRTTARLDFSHMPWTVLAGFFVPVLLVLFAVYGWQRRAGAADGPAAPSVRAISATFGNSLQVGIPVVLALFGEAGLGLHIAIVSLHALILLAVLTTLVELDLARARSREGLRGGSLAVTLKTTVRNTLVHPVVLPVLLGMVWNLTGLGLHEVVDEVLQLLISAVVPLCLTLIGLSLAYYGVRGALRPALVLSVLKLVVLPAVVLTVAHLVFGLRGLPLQVVVMLSALPAGSNALIFAQRYRTLEAEVTAAVVMSTFGFGLTAPLWLAALAQVA